MNQRILRVLPALCLPALLLAGALGVATATDEAASPDSLRVSTAAYRVPDVQLVRQDGKAVSLAEEMNDGRPVVLNFIFTSCEAICPMMTQTFAVFQRQLGAESSHVHLMSISIDPDGHAARGCGIMPSASAQAPGGPSTPEARRQALPRKRRSVSFAARRWITRP